MSAHPKGAAGALLTQPGDTVEVVGGHGLVLLLQEAEGREVEPCVLTLSVLTHVCHLVPRAAVSRHEWRASH